MNPSVIEVEAVVKAYPRHRALNGVSFTVPAGVCMALLGHNGAGKTTLMKLLLGLTRSTAGRIQVLGEDPARADLDFRRQIGFLPENVIFHDELTGEETLRHYARLKGEDPRRRGVLLERVGLADAAGRRVKGYSKGMRQRLGLAQALLGRPKLLMLDEPTTGLDPMLRQEFYRVIQELRAEGVTILLSSHVLTELEARTDLAMILEHGRISAFGTLEELRREAALPAVFRIRTRDPEGVIRSIGGEAEARRVGDAEVELTTPVEEKMVWLRRLMEAGMGVEDVEIQLPTLDHVYAHFGSDRRDNPEKKESP
ncbi:MAG: ABC transporter ATP-binding protein [Magnetococcales bacterium]|nr:ABC transporter ATP-binding protein [Magnetococcales bacterium]